MLRFLTHKLKSQTLNEHQAHVYETDERDSGTESDEDHASDCSTLDLTDIPRTSPDKVTLVPVNNLASCSRHDSRAAGNENNSPTKTHEISEHNFDSISCTSDYERYSLDFDRHSSEDELGIINKENLGETRVYSWTPTNRAGLCDSAGSTDEEVKDFLLSPQPVLMSASPPKGVQKVYTHKLNTSPRLVLAHMAPVAVTTVTVSPRKRCHRNITPDKLSDSELEGCGQRPCLDFEKMQQVGVYAPKKWKAGITL